MKRPGGLLWVTAEIPDRTLGGGNIRHANLIEALAEHVAVDLAVVGDVRDERVRGAVRSLIEVPSPERDARVRGKVDVLRLLAVERTTFDLAAHRPAVEALRRHVVPLANGYDAVIVNHQGLAPLLPRTRRSQWWFHPQFLASERSRQAAKIASGRRRWMFAVEARHGARAEKWAVRAYDGLVTVSAEDADALTTGLDAAERPPVVVAPNGVDLDAFSFSPLPPQPRVVLTASLDYDANVDGACWFVERVWPLVRSSVPAAELDIVGRNPAPAVRDLAGPAGVAVHADVPAIAPWLARARVAVVPLRIGTGTRLKVLEALASGRPVVGTTIGLEGLGLHHPSEARRVDEPAGFAAAVVDLLGDDSTAERQRVAGRAVVEDRFSWQRIGRELAVNLGAGGPR